jgi:YVTN family beta-propeller protein
VAVAVNAATNKIYVANSGDNTVSVIDGAGNTTSTVPVDQYPQAIAINPVTNKIYVVDYASNDVSVIDGTSNTSSNIAVGSGPFGVAVNPTSNRIYVANTYDNSVTMIDGATYSTATVPVGYSPSGIAVNPITNRIYVANLSSNNITVIDGASNFTNSLPAGAGAYAVAVNPVSNKIYVANSGSNSVTVIDGASGSTLTVPAGVAPWAVAIDSVTNKVFVPNEGSNSVTVIDGAPFNTSTLTVGAQPFGIDVDATNNLAYVANTGDSTVSVINGAGAVTATVPVGSGPANVAVDGLTRQIYVANQLDNSVSVIDGASNGVTVVPVGQSPNALSVNAVTNKIYVANTGSGNVTVMDGATDATANVTVGDSPAGIAINPATNKVYVALYVASGSSSVAIIDGGSNSVSSVATGSGSHAVAVNPLTNKIYVANESSSDVTVIDGATNATTSVYSGPTPYALAVNPLTNRIYVANSGGNSVTVIDGATNSTASIAVGSNPVAIAVNLISNKVYVTNAGTDDVTVIDGATNIATNVATGTNPRNLAINPVTGEIYVPNLDSGNVTVINESPRIAQGYTAVSQPLDGNTADALPTFTLYAADGQGNPITPLGVFWQIDSTQGAWTTADGTGGSSFSATVRNPLSIGTHVLYAYPVEGDAGNPTLDAGTPRMGDVSAYLFTVTSITAPLGQMTSPAPGSVLPGTSATFNWTAGSQSSAYWLDAGSTPGGNQYFQSGNLGNMLSATAGGLPSDGSTVYVTLWSLANGQWRNEKYAYTAFNSAADLAVMQTPAPGSTFGGTTVIFSWTSGVGATAYWLDLGSTAGGNQYGQSGNLGNALTTTVSGLPTDGSTVYGTLYSLIGGQWYGNAYTYTAFSTANGIAAMQSPTPGSTLSSSSVAFTWSAGTGATGYWLDIGSAAGGNQYYQSGNLGGALTTTASGLPTDGSTVYVTLYSLVGGQWLSRPYTYTAFSAGSGLAVMQTPTPGSTLNGSTATFTWSGGAGATGYWFDIGNVVGGNQYYQSGNLGNVLTTTVTTLPADGSQVYVTLYSLIGGQWYSNAYMYISAQATNHIVMALVLDRSGSMASNGGSTALAPAVTAFVDDFNNAADFVGLASFASNATLDVPIGNNFQAPITTAVNSYSYGGGTFGVGGLAIAQNQVNSVVGLTQPVKVVVYFTDGLVNIVQDTFQCTSSWGATLYNYGGYDSGSTVDFFNPANGTDWGGVDSNGYPPHSPAPDCTGVTHFTSQQDSTQKSFTRTNVSAEAQYRALAVANSTRSQGTYIYAIGLGTAPTQQFLQAIANDPAGASYNPNQPPGLAVFVPDCPSSSCSAELQQVFATIASHLLPLRSRLSKQ